MIYIKDNLVVVNNPLENKLFIFDRLSKIQYDINADTFDILEDIKSNLYSKKMIVKKYGLEFINQLFELNIITEKRQKNINNVKRIKKYNNVRLFVELTNKCNLNCKHCYGGFACSNNLFLNIEDLKKVIDDAAKNGVYQFDMTGGEPTLYPNIYELIEYAYNSGMIMRIFTNLTTFNSKFKKIILKYGVKEIVTSLDSCIESDHDEFRGQKGSFKKTLSAIKELQSENISLALNTMIGNHNKDHIDELVKFINDLKIKSVLDVIMPDGRGKKLNESIKDSAKIIKSIYQKNSEKIDKEAISIGCGVADRFIYIKSDGNIYLCPSLICAEYKLGNIKNYSTKKIWKYMIERFNDIKCKEKNSKCKNCTGGCRARALKMHNDICAKDDVYCIINGVDER